MAVKEITQAASLSLSPRVVMAQTVSAAWATTPPATAIQPRTASEASRGRSCGRDVGRWRAWGHSGTSLIDLSPDRGRMNAMTKRLLALPALVLLLAGCSGTPAADPGRPGITVSPSPTPVATPDATTTPGTPAGDGCRRDSDNIVVGSGATCELTGVRVDGNIEVQPGGTLVATHVTVDGNIQAERFTAVTVTGGSVDGDIQLERGGAAVVTGVRIDGNLQCEGNAPAPVGGENVVEGNREGQCASL